MVYNQLRFTSTVMRFFTFLALLQVISCAKLTPRTVSVGVTVTPATQSIELPKDSNSQYTRKRRCLGTIIQLLWPQVVGPVDDGIIKERTFEEIPKTLLEHRLDRIRKKAKQDEMSRLAVREYMQERLGKISQKFLSCSTTSSSTCHCSGICYCGLVGENILGGEAWPGEEYSDSRRTVVSWQHFPPSTSSRSRCDDTTMLPESRPSLPEICPPEVVEKSSTKTSVSSTEYPIKKSFAQLNAEHYLNVRNIFGLYNYMIGHLIVAEPEDPIAYLKDILDRALMWRNGYGEEPLLVSKFHIKSLYNTFDPFGNGSITEQQYHEAMENIGVAKGLTIYNHCPPLNKEKKVDEEFFLNETYRCLLGNLRKMVRIPHDWEENRILWKRRRLMRIKKEQICERSAELPVEEEEELTTALFDKWSEEDSIRERYNKECRQSQTMNLRQEPVQLFLPV